MLIFDIYPPAPGHNKWFVQWKNIFTKNSVNSGDFFHESFLYTKSHIQSITKYQIPVALTSFVRERRHSYEKWIPAKVGEAEKKQAILNILDEIQSFADNCEGKTLDTILHQLKPIVADKLIRFLPSPESKKYECIKAKIEMLRFLCFAGLNKLQSISDNCKQVTVVNLAD